MSSEAQRKITAVARSTLNAVQVVCCLTPRVTFHTICNVIGTPLELCGAQPMQLYAVTLAVTWIKNYYYAGEANYKYPLFWLTVFAYLFVPKRLKRVLF